MSLTVNESKVEHKHASQSYVGSFYLLPSDEEEAQRVRTQNKLYTNVLSGRLIFPPIQLSGKDEILDIGTGVGVWLRDVQSRLPEAVQIYGVDTESHHFPNFTTLSPNVHLSVCCGTDLPFYWNSKFTLVNQRLLICAYSREKWRRNIAEMYRVLAPGGYTQLVEIGPQWVSGPKTATHVLLMDHFFADQGLLFRCGIYLADMLKEVGFVDVKTEEIVMKLGKWAGDIGVQGRDMNIGAYRAMRESVMKAGGLGRFASDEEFHKTIDEMSEEWDNIEGSHTVLTVCYGRKPL